MGSDQVLRETNGTPQKDIIKWHSLCATLLCLSEEVTVKKESRDGMRGSHLSDDPANYVRECLKDLDRGAEGVYQFLIIIAAILLEGLFSLMEELEDRLGRI